MSGPDTPEPVECSCCTPRATTLAPPAEPPFEEHPALAEAALPSLPVVLAQRASVLVW